MNRRNFFSRLLNGIAGAGAMLGTGRAAERISLQSSPVAGFQFHDGDAIWETLHVGQPVALAREPANPHDLNAVAVLVGDYKIGYVPRGDNRVVARLLDQDRQLVATICKLSVSEDPWSRVEIEIATA